MSSREVVLEGGSPWGFRMHGGKDQGQTLRISRVNPGSRAAARGIREGDLISSIDGHSTANMTNGDAHGLLRAAGPTLRLGLNQVITGSFKRRGNGKRNGENIGGKKSLKTVNGDAAKNGVVHTEKSASPISEERKDERNGKGSRSEQRPGPRCSGIPRRQVGGNKQHMAKAKSDPELTAGKSTSTISSSRARRLRKYRMKMRRAQALASTAEEGQDCSSVAESVEEPRGGSLPPEVLQSDVGSERLQDAGQESVSDPEDNVPLSPSKRGKSFENPFFSCQKPDSKAEHLIEIESEVMESTGEILQDGDTPASPPLVIEDSLLKDLSQRDLRVLARSTSRSPRDSPDPENAQGLESFVIIVTEESHQPEHEPQVEIKEIEEIVVDVGSLTSKSSDVVCNENTFTDNLEGAIENETKIDFNLTKTRDNLQKDLNNLAVNSVQDKNGHGLLMKSQSNEVSVSQESAAGSHSNSDENVSVIYPASSSQTEISNNKVKDTQGGHDSENSQHSLFSPPALEELSEIHVNRNNVVFTGGRFAREQKDNSDDELICIEDSSKKEHDRNSPGNTERYQVKKYPSIVEAYLDHKIKQYELAIQRLDSPVPPEERPESPIFKECTAAIIQDEEDTSWEFVGELAPVEEPFFVKDFELELIDLSSEDKESNVDSVTPCQGNVVSEFKLEISGNYDLTAHEIGEISKHRPRKVDVHGPSRFLDVIVEESSDVSDNEKNNGGPETNIINEPQTTSHMPTSRLSRPLRIPCSPRRKMNIFTVEGSVQPTEKMVVKLTELKLDVQETKVQESKKDDDEPIVCLVEEVQTTQPMAVSDGSSGEVGNDGVEIVYLEDGSSTSSVSSKVTVKSDEDTDRVDEDAEDLDLHLDCMILSGRSEGMMEEFFEAQELHLRDKSKDVMEDDNKALEPIDDGSKVPEDADSSVTSEIIDNKPREINDDTNVGDHMVVQISNIHSSNSSTVDSNSDCVVCESPCTELPKMSLSATVGEGVTNSPIPDVVQDAHSSPLAKRPQMSEDLNPSTLTPCETADLHAINNQDNTRPSAVPVHSDCTKDKPSKETCDINLDEVVMPVLVKDVCRSSPELQSNITNEKEENETPVRGNGDNVTSIIDNLNKNISVIGCAAVESSSSENTTVNDDKRDEELDTQIEVKSVFIPELALALESDTDTSLRTDVVNDENISSEIPSEKAVNPKEVLNGSGITSHTKPKDDSSTDESNKDYSQNVQSTVIKSEDPDLEIGELITSLQEFSEKADEFPRRTIPAVPPIDDTGGTSDSVTDMTEMTSKQNRQADSRPKPPSQYELQKGRQSLHRNPVARIIEDFFQKKNRKSEPNRTKSPEAPERQSSMWALLHRPKSTRDGKSKSKGHPNEIASPEGSYYRTASPPVPTPLIQSTTVYPYIPEGTHSSSTYAEIGPYFRDVVSPDHTLRSRTTSPPSVPTSPPCNRSVTVSKSRTLSPPATISVRSDSMSPTRFLYTEIGPYQSSAIRSVKSPSPPPIPERCVMSPCRSETDRGPMSPISSRSDISEALSPPPGYSRKMSSSSGSVSHATAVFVSRVSPVSSTTDDQSAQRPMLSKPSRSKRSAKITDTSREIGFRPARPTHFGSENKDLPDIFETDLFRYRGKSLPLNTQSSSVPRCLPDGKLVFLSSPPLVTSPPPGQRRSCVWTGRQASGLSPHILLCLSPSQRNCFKDQTPTPDECADLLDMHKKFIERRAYHEIPPPPPRRHSTRNRSQYLNTVDWINHLPPVECKRDYVNDWMHSRVGTEGASESFVTQTGESWSLRSTPTIEPLSSLRRQAQNETRSEFDHFGRLEVDDEKVTKTNDEERDVSRLLAILRGKLTQDQLHREASNSHQFGPDATAPATEPAAELSIEPRSAGDITNTTLANESMSKWLHMPCSDKERDSGIREPATYVFHVGGKNKYEFRSDCAKNAAANVAKCIEHRIERCSDLIKRKNGDNPKTFSSILKDKLFWNLSNLTEDIDDSHRNIRHTPPRHGAPPSNSKINQRRGSLPEGQLFRKQASSLEGSRAFQFDSDSYKISKQGDVALVKNGVCNSVSKDGDAVSVYEDLGLDSAYWSEGKCPSRGGHSMDETKVDMLSSHNKTHGVHQRASSVPDDKYRMRFTNSSEEECFRGQMYLEYMKQVAERNKRREQKVIKISDPESITGPNAVKAEVDLSVSETKAQDGVGATIKPGDHQVSQTSQLEQEFMDKVRARQAKYGLQDHDRGVPDTVEALQRRAAKKDCVVIKAANDNKTATVTDVHQLPKHLQEFLSFSQEGDHQQQDQDQGGVWTPGATQEHPQDQDRHELDRCQDNGDSATTPAAPIWTPRSAGASPQVERKAFRPVNFESPVLPRKNKPQQENGKLSPPLPPWKDPNAPEIAEPLSPSSTSGSPGGLPRAPNPTVTLLQKAREGQLPRGAQYLDSEDGRPLVSETAAYVRAEDADRHTLKRHPEPAPRRFETGPARNGVPTSLRSDDDEEANPESKERWYKRMYDQLHKIRQDDDFVTVRYRPSRKDDRISGRAGRSEASSPSSTMFQWPGGRSGGSGYQSEPELGHTGYPDMSKYATLDRRRGPGRYASATSSAPPPVPAPPAAAPVPPPAPAPAPVEAAAPTPASAPVVTTPRSKAVSESLKYAAEVYKNQPGRIENYEPGRSSISDKEAKQWWDEVLDIFDGWLDDQCAHWPPPRRRRLCSDAYLYSMEQRNKENLSASKSFMTYALKESGYESDTQLVLKRREEGTEPLSPAQQRTAYKVIQRGGDVPLHGLRKTAPERPKDDSEIEYFAHLSRVGIHKRNVTPSSPRRLRSYPLPHPRGCSPTPSPSPSYPKRAASPSPPPTFSKYKRTAPSLVPLLGSPPPPLPPADPPTAPRRRSSRGSTVRMWSRMSFRSPSPPARIAPRRTVSASAADSKVQFLRDRLSVKLGVEEESRKQDKRKVKTSSKDKVGRVSRKDASYAGQRVQRTCQSPSAKTKFEIHKPRRDISSRICKSPELSAPTEVRKVLRQTEQTAHKAKERSGAVVRSSTTLYSSKNARSSPSDDKALRVTVAISAKGRELVKSKQSSKSVSSRSKGVLSPSSSPSPSLHSPRSSSGIREAVISDAKRPSSRSTLRTSSLLSLDATDGRHRRHACTTPPDPVTLYRSPPKKIIVDQKVSMKHDDKESARKKSRKLRPESIVFAGTDQSPKKMSTRKSSASSRSKVKSTTPSVIEIKRSEVTPCEKRKLPAKTMHPKVLKELNTNVCQSRDSPEQPSNRTVRPYRSDHFFQHLLCRDLSPAPHSSSIRSMSVLERAQLFGTDQRRDSRAQYKSEPSLRSLSVYLQHKRPVSDSKFRSLDRATTSRSPSPPVRGLQPKRPVCVDRDHDFFSMVQKFDSLSQSDVREVGRSRARSAECWRVSVCQTAMEPTVPTPLPPPLPPPPEQRSRGSSPSGTLSRSPSHRRIQGTRVSKTVKTVEGLEGLRRRPVRAKSASEADYSFKGSRELREARDARSLSSQSLAQLADHHDYQAYVLELVHSTKKSDRFRELNQFYSTLERMGQLERAASTGDLRPRMKNEEVIDYDRWKQLRTKEKAEEELQILYERLKRDQRQKDLLFSTKDVNTLRWKGDRGLRIKEKSVEDLRRHFKKLSMEESELEASRRKDLEARKDVYKPLWRGNSVANLASSLRHTTASHRGRPVTCEHEISRSLDRKHYTRSHSEHTAIGNRLWSSLSLEQVNALKSQLSEIYSHGPGKKKKRMDYDSNKENYEITVPPRGEDCKHVLHVRSNSLVSSEDLYAEILTRKELKRAETMKADSISSLTNWRDEIDTSFHKPLTESEKRKISMTLSAEVMDRVEKRRAKSVVSPRETLGAVAAADAKIKKPTPANSAHTEETVSPRTCYSLEMSLGESTEKYEDGSKTTLKQNNDFLLVLAPSGSEIKSDLERAVEDWASPKKVTHVQERQTMRIQGHVSETESASSEASTKTVIHVGDNQDFHKKIEYFESMEEKRESLPISGSTSAAECTEGSERIIQMVDTRSGSGTELSQQIRAESASKRSSSGLFASHSYTDLKELFGESPAGHHYVQSAAVSRSRRRTVSLGSQDSLLRSPSPDSGSPDPTKYYRAYIRMVKSGDVRRLTDRFESLDDLTYMCARSGGQPTPIGIAKVRTYRSDPDLLQRRASSRQNESNKVVIRGQECGDVNWLRRKYEPWNVPGRRRRARSSPPCSRSPASASPVPRKPLGAEDRFMPHINVISKTASLQRRSARSGLSSQARQEADKFHTGEVRRIRDKFESTLSLLGQMFTSTPDVRELRDIAPYLGCKWVAHRFPEQPAQAPLSRSMSSLDIRRSITPSRSPCRPLPRPRPASASPTRRQPHSILKQPPARPPPTYVAYDRFANQPFDPTIHRPVCRYQPPPPPPEHVPKRPWTPMDYWWRHCTSKRPASSRPTVTFKDPESEILFTKSVAPVPKAYESEPESGVIPRSPPVPAPALPKSYESEPESPHRYLDSEVTIHYRSPVSLAARDAGLGEEELARRQAEAMRRLYQEERRRKYLHELQDANSRRHTDNFTPSQKSPIPLNRYDDFADDYWATNRARSRTPVPRLVARALYNFVGQTPRELSFRRGDIIFVKRQVDKNWYEGEHNAMIGLFPFNYVEIIPYDSLRATATPKRVQEGQARAKFNFIAQTGLELSLAKGELVTLVRRVDDNWFEGRIGNQKGIFPVSYVEVLLEPSERPIPTPIVNPKPVASPAAHSLLINGGSARASMGQHHYTPPTSSSPANYSGSTNTYANLNATKSSPLSVNQTLHIDTQSEPVPYRALYNYRPQNDDELELLEGDIVLVMEKCDDGWYVGSSQRTGFFGTFPGNYVDRI